MSDIPKPWGFDLWKHLSDEHGLTLLESEVQAIVHETRRIDAPDSPLLAALDEIGGPGRINRGEIARNAAASYRRSLGIVVDDPAQIDFLKTN